MERGILQAIQFNEEANLWKSFLNLNFNTTKSGKSLKSENEVIERLLERRVEMQPVYNELAKKLSEPQQETLWGILISAAAFWNLDEAKKLRAERKKLLELNETIAFTAKQLAGFIKQIRTCIKKKGKAICFHKMSMSDFV